MDLRLLVLRAVIRHRTRVAELLERLPEPGDIAMAEDPPDPRDEAALCAVALDVLRCHELDDGLTNRQPDCAHFGPPPWNDGRVLLPNGCARPLCKRLPR